MAVPRVPPGRAGRAVRPAPAARTPRARRARRTPVDVRDRRGTGAPLRHRRAGAAWDRRRDQAGRGPVDVRGADGRRGRGRRVQPPRVAGRSRPLARSVCCGRTRSTSARSASRSARATSKTRSSRLPHVASSLVELFESKFEPGLDDREAALVAARGPAGDRPRCDPAPRRRSHLPGVHDADRRDGAHQPVPREADAVVQARPGRDPRPAATAPDVRDLRVFTAGRGRPPARRADRAWRDPLERPPGGLPHRGARARQGADGEERGHRAGRRQGRVSSSRTRRPTRPNSASRARSATASSCAALLDLTDNVVGGVRASIRPTR